MQVEYDGKIQPTFTRPDICDVTSPLLVGCIRCKVPIQQIGRNVELVIAVPLSADCFAIACRAMVVARRAAGYSQNAREGCVCAF